MIPVGMISVASPTSAVLEVRMGIMTSCSNPVYVQTDGQKTVLAIDGERVSSPQPWDFIETAVLDANFWKN
jgi:hypothetical protein